jgi:membrane protease YdiL (CAAX protease family)
MNEKNFPDDELNYKSKNSSKKSTEFKWEFCPRCGNPLPSIKNTKFCMQCGLDFQYFMQYKSLPPTIQLKPVVRRTIIEDDEILTTKNKKLWGLLTSLGLPILCFIAIEITIIVVTLIIIFPLIFTTQNINEVLNFLSSPLFLSLATLAELIFLLAPILVAGRYIKNPTFNNRVKLLGIYNNKSKDYFILKEVLIGIAFAGIAFLAVNIVSILTDLGFGAIFGQEFLESAYGSEEGTEFTSGFIPANILELILLIAMMILVVGPSEEVIFRGFTQRGWDRYLGTKWGLLFTALLFTFFHVIPILVPIELFLLLFPPYFVISLMLGVLYVWRKENLIACIIGHGLYNALAIIIAFLF